MFPGPELCLHFPKATPSRSLSCYIQKYVSWILRIKKERTETGMYIILYISLCALNFKNFN